MNNSKRFIVTVVLIGVYLLSACTGAAPQQENLNNPTGSQSTEVVFTGTVEAMGGSQWLISGQQVDVNGSSMDANIQLGDIVRVEAAVSQDGTVFAVKIESSGPDDANMNDSSANDNSANSNDVNINSNDNSNSGIDNSNSNANSNDAAGVEQEVYGVVESMADGTITIDGIMYNLSSITEFKDIISIGDQVKIHVFFNGDGTFTIREIEKVMTIGENDNSNSNDNDQLNSNSNDNGNDDDHSNNNSNSNDDDDDEDSSGNSNSSHDD